MRRVVSSTWSLGTLAVLFCTFVFAWSASAVAQDDSAAASAEDADDESAKADPFEIPADASAEELIELAKELMQVRGEGETREEQEQFATRTFSSLVDISEQLLKVADGTRHKQMGLQLKFMSLDRLADLGDEKAARRLRKEIAVAKKSDDPLLAGMGWQTYVGQKVYVWDDLTDKQKQALQRELIAEIKKKGPQQYHVSIVNMTAEELAHYDPNFAKQLLNAAVPLFLESDDDRVAKSTVRLEGLTRRLNLPGNEIELSGELLGGGELDWKSYRGKVVLVDFWATWCGPCRAEVPNILKMYEGYHDKGFDVLGVSLDKTAKAAKKYVEEQEIPWESLFPDDEDQRGWDHPLVDYYAINGIPTAILVDAEGRVVHMNARGRELREQLQLLLGDPIEKKEAEKEDDEADAEE